MGYDDRDRSLQSPTKNSFSKEKISFLSNGKRQEWIRFITVVLAFIGLWRVLEGSLALFKTLF